MNPSCNRELQDVMFALLGFNLVLVTSFLDVFLSLNSDLSSGKAAPSVKILMFSLLTVHTHTRAHEHGEILW